MEVNSHSLFSKWFSESGKLVQSMFDDIIELREDPDVLVVVMIDEVESLTSSREASGEPSDALRVSYEMCAQLIYRWSTLFSLSSTSSSSSTMCS